MLDTFQLETFVDRKVAIPDLKLEAALGFKERTK
jgi:hypothetical protein